MMKMKKKQKVKPSPQGQVNLNGKHSSNLSSYEEFQKLCPNIGVVQ